MPHPREGGMTMRVMFRGRLATLISWRCAARDTAPGAPEASRGNEIVFTRRGCFERRMRGETVVADPATALFFPRHEAYRVGHPRSGGDAGVVLSIADELAQEIGAPSRPGAGRLRPGQALRLHRLMACLEALSGPEGTASALDIEERVLALAGETMAAVTRRPPTGGRYRQDTLLARRRRVEKVKLLLASSFQDRLALRAIARDAACSPFHLCRIFREETGSTIHRHLNRLRLMRALDMLEPGADLASVALEVGFSSHSHFSAAFRLEFGLPPSVVARGAGPRWTSRIRKNLTARSLRPA